jgi:hypothetical protein
MTARRWLVAAGVALAGHPDLTEARDSLAALGNAVR